MTDLDQTQLRVLAHYATGTDLTSIAAILRLDRDVVLDMVRDLTGCDRKKAGEALARLRDRDRKRRSRAAEEKPPPTAEAASAEPVVPAPEPVPEPDDDPEPDPPPATPRGPRVLSWWDAFLCETCSSRYFLPRDCCGDETTPVTVTITLRGA